MIFVAKYVNSKGNKAKLPPGGRGWPLVGDSIRWYNAVASSNPTAFVQQQVLRYIKPDPKINCIRIKVIK